MLQNTFFRRLFYYLIGFFLGLILVFLFFGNKGCSWLPSNQVRDVISKKIIISTSVKFNPKNISNLLENSEVDFDKSDKKSNNKSYFFKLTSENSTIQTFFVSFNPESYFAIIHESEKELTNYKNDTVFKIISVPNGTNSLVNYEENNPIKIQLKDLNMDSKNYFNTLIKNGYLTYNYSKPNNSIVEIYLKNQNNSNRVYYKWENYVLTPIKIENR